MFTVGLDLFVELSDTAKSELVSAVIASKVDQTSQARLPPESAEAASRASFRAPISMHSAEKLPFRPRVRSGSS